MVKSIYWRDGSRKLAYASILILIYLLLRPEKIMPFLEFSHPSEGKEKITLDSRWGLGGGHSESFGKGTSTSSKGGGPSPVKLPRHEAESVSARN